MESYNVISSELNLIMPIYTSGLNFFFSWMSIFMQKKPSAH